MRGRGFLLGVEYVDPADGESFLDASLGVARKIDMEALRRGLIVYSTQPVAADARKTREGAVGARARRALDEGLRNVRPGVKLDKLGYVVHLEDNLLPGITRAQIEDAFGAGAGQELEGKMRAPWSSSALAVNSFAPWQHDPGVLTVAGISGFTKTLAFEAQCPNGDPASSRCPA